MVLIDEPKNGWSHMVSNDLDELHEFAQKIGVKRHYFHNKSGRGKPHYDVRHHRFDSTIESGAKLVRSRDIVVFLKKYFSV